MSASNPLISALDVRGYMEAGNRWASLAAHCADRARECWAIAGERITQTERAIRELAPARSKERADDRATWDEIRRELDEIDRERAA